jgi:hypothetical protein
METHPGYMESKLSIKGFKRVRSIPMNAARLQTIRTLTGWVALYLVTLGVTSTLILTGSLQQPLKSIVMLLPLLPALGILLWQVRIFRQMDEMQTKHQLLAVAWAFAGTALFSIAYALLEIAGWPHLPMFAVWLVMLSLWVACSWVQRVRYA